MSDKPVCIAAALGAGIMLGIPLGAIAAANILPVTVGEGWANIGGAAVGVLGAFLVANWSFHKNTKAQEKRLMRPIQLRFDYCEEYLSEISILAEKHSSLQRVLFEDIKEITKTPDMWNPINRSTLEKYVPPQEVAISIVTRCSDYPLSEFKEISRLAKSTAKELHWLREHKREDLSPLDIEATDNVIEKIDYLTSTVGTIYFAVSQIRYIHQSKNPLPNLPLISSAVITTEKHLVPAAKSALSQIRGLRAIQ